MTNKSDYVMIYTDGACSGNPGPGGWGAVLQWRDKEKELSGAASVTTNNAMELTAVIQALEALKRPMRVIISTDSRYVKDGITKWIHRWKRNGWQTIDKQPVKNMELWQRLEANSAKHTIVWRWIKGHSGHAENERADKLARTAIAKISENRLQS